MSLLIKLLRWFQNESLTHKLEHIIVLLSAWKLYKHLTRDGRGLGRNILRDIVRALRSTPVLAGVVNSTLDAEADKTIKEMLFNQPQPLYERLPKQGIAHEKLLTILKERAAQNLQPSQGRAWAYVYDVDRRHTEFTGEVYKMFVHTNYLNPMKYISLRNMEVETLAMTANMLNGDTRTCVGCVSSGGSESILLAIKAYRDHFFARKPHFSTSEAPEIIMCRTAHPAFNKAAKLFRLNIVYVDCEADTKRMRVDQIAAKITPLTAVIIASATQYPHGVVDPEKLQLNFKHTNTFKHNKTPTKVEQIAALAQLHDLPVHVDAAIGGWVLPWVEKLGHPVPVWDFRVPNVQSINLDIHKYGFAPKGSSALIFRTSELRRHVFTVYAGWPGGLYISPTLLGSRNGGAIAAAWASLMALGESGFLDAVRRTIETTHYFIKEIGKIDGLRIVGTPHATLFAFESTNTSQLNIYHVSDALEELGWHMERQQDPPSLHCSVMPQHFATKEAFVQDLRTAVEKASRNPEKYRTKSAAMYGMVASIPDDAVIDDFMLRFMDKMFSFNVLVQ